MCRFRSFPYNFLLWNYGFVSASFPFLISSWSYSSVVSGAEVTDDDNFNRTATKFMQHNNTILSVFQDVALSSWCSVYLLYCCNVTKDFSNKEIVLLSVNWLDCTILLHKYRSRGAICKVLLHYLKCNKNTAFNYECNPPKSKAGQTWNPKLHIAFLLFHFHVIIFIGEELKERAIWFNWLNFRRDRGS